MTGYGGWRDPGVRIPVLEWLFSGRIGRFNLQLCSFQPGTSLCNIFLYLLYQGLHGTVFLLGTQILHEFQLDRLVIQILMKIQQVRFDGGARRVAVKGGADSQAGCGWVGLAVHPGPAGVDAISGHDLFRQDLDIGRGDINGVAAPIKLFKNIRMEDFREHLYDIDNAGGRAADGVIVK
jgi:hypothetical protein